MECLLSKNGGLDLAKMDIEVRDNKGRTPFHLACIYGQYEMAKMLLQVGRADPTVRQLKL